MQQSCICRPPQAHWDRCDLGNTGINCVGKDANAHLGSVSDLNQLQQALQQTKQIKWSHGASIDQK
jgi:hypothetical protein